MYSRKCSWAYLPTALGIVSCRQATVIDASLEPSAMSMVNITLFAINDAVDRADINREIGNAPALGSDVQEVLIADDGIALCDQVFSKPDIEILPGILTL